MKVVEIYSSIQGEGPHAGEPTTFVRFGGCNLRCPGWGSGKLPTGATVAGCDTVFAVYPEWRQSWRDTSIDSILRAIPFGVDRVCITGGEPLIQSAAAMADLVDELLARGKTIDLFTNGTRALPSWVHLPEVTVVMDYKLPGSGEYDKFVFENLDFYEDAHLKFVCKDDLDFHSGVDDIEIHDLRNRTEQIWFGVVWDSRYGVLTDAMLSALILKHAPYAKLNIQMHNHIWPPNERAR